MKFNLKVTSFNNVRFGFSGALKYSYLIFLFIPLLFIFIIGTTIYLSTFLGETLFIILFVTSLILCFALFSYFQTIKTRYLINNTSYANAKFSTNINTSNFLKIIFKTFLIVVILFTIAVTFIFQLLVSFLNTQNMTIESLYYEIANYPEETISFLFPIIILAYILLIIASTIAFIYYFIRARKYIFENTTLNNDVYFQSNMKFFPYSFIVLTNILLIIFTLGLAYPWAKVRVIKYTLKNTEIEAKSGFDGYLDLTNEKVSGFADQVSDTLFRCRLWFSYLDDKRKTL